MVWLRVIFVVLFFWAGLIFGFVYCIVYALGNGDLIEAREEQISRLPVVNQFLSKNVREFDPEVNEVDRNVNSCCICLGEFVANNGKEIAELDCNKNHIFHLKCI